jgi:hypothetical protein
MRLTIVCLFAFYSFGVQAQVDIINTSLYKADIRYLYCGIDNIIKVAGIKDGDNYTLVSSSGSQIKTSNFSNIFYLLVTQPNTKDTIKVIKNDTAIYQKIFTTEQTKEPVLRFGLISQPFTTVKQLSSPNELLLAFPDSNLTYSIRSFTFVSSRKSKKEINCVGNSFTPKVYAAIKKLKSGDTVFIDNIKAGCPDGTTRTLMPFNLTIR